MRGAYDLNFLRGRFDLIESVMILRYILRGEGGRVWTVSGEESVCG